VTKGIVMGGEVVCEKCGSSVVTKYRKSDGRPYLRCVKCDAAFAHPTLFTALGEKESNSMKDLMYLGPDPASDIKVDTPKQKKNMAIQALRNTTELDIKTLSFNALYETAMAYLFLCVADPGYKENATSYLIEAYRRLHFNRTQLKTADQKAVANARMAQAWAFLAAIDEGFSMAGAVKQMALSLGQDPIDEHIDMYEADK
jgi:DNA-directed RNA polymerase subunit RPC12/RpoP